MSVNLHFPAIYLAVFLTGILMSPSLSAQIPPGYYDAAHGKTGNELKLALHFIIKGHSALSYAGTWSAFNTTDKKPGTNNIWDIYSDNPGGTTAYHFTYSHDQCSGSTPSSEGGCYNREHIWPQSLFGSNAPMHSDLWIVYPTDAVVNGKRSNYPFGEVTSATWTSTNGSQLGTNTYPGAPSTLCFEPHDSVKGDIARSYFYIATRYYSQDIGWSSWEMASGADLKPWARQMLLDWHHSDPVSQKEINRNNAVYTLQNNRNPFIDHPELADCIFGVTADCTHFLSVNDLQQPVHIAFYPNPADHDIFFSFEKSVEIRKTSVYNIFGQEIRDIRTEQAGGLNHYKLSCGDLAAGIYFVHMTSEDGQAYSGKFIKQ